MEVKYIVYHKYGIRSDDTVGGFFESYHSYSRDNYTSHPMKAKHYSSLSNALKHRVGLNKKNWHYAIELKRIFDKQYGKQISRIKKLNRINDLDDTNGLENITYDDIKFFTNENGEEITKIHKIIIDGENITTESADNEIYEYILEMIRKKELEDEKLHKFTFENTNMVIVDDADDDFWN